MSKILREFKKEPITILCSATHEAYQTNLSKLPYNFVMWDFEGSKSWNSEFRPIPSNYTYLKNLTNNVQIDCVLSQDKGGQFPIMNYMAQQRRVPHVVLTHTTPGEDASRDFIKKNFEMQGHVNVFITEFSAKAWGFRDRYEVINHMIDTNQFKCNNKISVSRDPISVVNLLKDRDRECGYQLWEDITRGMKKKLVGQCNYGIGEPANGPDDLVKKLNDHIIFLNTSLISPLPMSLLEAMACGMVVVSSATCHIPSVIKHQYNGFLYDPNRPQNARSIIKQLQDMPLETLRQIGENARQTILEQFNEKTFLNKWKTIFDNVCS